MIEEPTTIFETWIDDSVMDKLSKNSHEKKYKGVYYGIDFTIQISILSLHWVCFHFQKGAGIVWLFSTLGIRLHQIN
jgi:hypothetical protein